MLNAGTPLEPGCHNAARERERDGLKSFGIGQSAARNNCRCSADSKQFFSLDLDKSFVFMAVGSTSAWGEVHFVMNENFSLRSFADEVWQDVVNDGYGEFVSPCHHISDAPGLKLFGPEVTLCDVSYKSDYILITHGQLDTGSVLKTDWAVFGCELLDEKATFAVHNSSDVSGSRDIHISSPVQRLSRKGVPASAGKCMASSIIDEMKEGDIVFSSSKGEAALTSGVGISEPTRKFKNIPPYMADDYVSIAHPTTFRNMKNELEAVHQYVETGFRMILNGEIGRYEGVRFVEQTNIAKEVWVNAKSNFAFFFGDDTVAEAIAIPEEMRGRIPTDSMTRVH